MPVVEPTPSRLYHDCMWFRSIALLISTLVLSTCLGATPPHRSPAPKISLFVEPASGAGPVLNLIRSARHSISLEVYLLTDRDVVAALDQARSRGVNVRVLLEEHPYGAGRYAQLGYDALRSDGINVRWAYESAYTYTHEKAMVVDNDVVGIFTFNLSSSGVESNREFGVIDRAPYDARVLTGVFNADWNRRAYHLPGTHLVISPYNSRHVFQALIAGAHHTLDLYAEEVADSQIEGDLIAAKRRGVTVRLITSSDSPGVEALRRGGIPVKIMTTPYVHAKAIVADRVRLYIGSENISATSLDKNREAGIQLTNPSAAAIVERTFAADWSGSDGSTGATTSPTPPPPPSSSHGLTLRLSVSPSTVSRDQLITITARTSAGASCTIRVVYPDGYTSRAKDLSGSRKASSAGVVTWAYHVGSTATGTAHANVACSLGAKSASGNVAFVIR